MLDSLITWFNQFLRRFTYRQRFVFWAFIYVLVIPFPNYWIFKQLNFFIEQVDLQFRGNQEANLRWSEFDDALRQNISINGSVDRPENFPHHIEKLNLQVRQLASDYRLLLQDSEPMVHLARALFFSLLQDQKLIIELTAIVKKVKIENPPSQELLAQATARLYLFKQHVEETVELLESSFRSIKDNFSKFDISYDTVNEQLMDFQRLNGQFINSIREIILAAQNLQVPKEDEVLFLRNQSLKLLNVIRKTHDNADLIFTTLLHQKRTFYWWLQFAVIAALCFTSAVAVFFLVFHVLTGHLLKLLSYIQELTSGNFSPLGEAATDDEVGQISIAFHKMGSAVENVALQMQELSKKLKEFTKNLILSTDEQKNAVVNQKESLRILDENFNKILSKSNNLANIIDTFFMDSQQRLREDSGRDRLNHMQGNLAFLTDASKDTLNKLTLIEDKVLNARSLIELMVKVSEQAHLLSLNAAIEASGSQHHHQIFNDISLKIQDFSEIASSTVMTSIKTINGMIKSLYVGKKTAETCLKEINTSANRLIIVGDQLSQITWHSEELILEFQIVSGSIQELTEESKGGILFLANLRDRVEANAESVNQLYQTIGELEMTAQVLTDILQKHLSRYGNK